MSRTNAVRRAGVGLLLLSLVLAGCGGGNEGNNASSDEPTTTAAGVRDGAELEADQELADSMVLTLADLGPGWTEEEDDGPDAADDAIGEEFSKCTGTSPDDDEKKIEAESPDFARGEGTSTGARVIVSATEAKAKKGITILKREKTVGCMGDALLDGFKKGAAEDADAAGATFDGFEFEQVASPEVGDDSVLLAGKVDITAEGEELSVFFDYLLVREGRIVSVLFATNFGEAFDRDELEGLAGIMADKMEGKEPAPPGSGSGARGRETTAGESSDTSSGASGTSGGTKTFRDSRFALTFQYPGAFETGTLTGVAKSYGNSLASAVVGPDPGVDTDNGIIVTKYGLEAPVTMENLLAAVAQLDAVVADATGGTHRGRMTEIGGFPAIVYADLDVPVPASGQSRLVYLFDGTTEYQINCQSTPPRRALVKSACDTVLGSLEKA